MKNQNDLIISIVAIVLSAILVIVWWQTAPTVVKPAEPEQPQNTPIALPTASVVYTNALPASNPGGGGFGPGGGGGGPMGMMGAGDMAASGPGGGASPAGFSSAGPAGAGGGGTKPMPRLGAAP
ncbi:MAG TPA: hypothetical protein VM328_07795 [Fimbriimonadaceae bacterium]|nr:hypothetical protein [Fimbriimonadaceae bacterium]